MAMLKPPFRADTPKMLLKKIMQGEYEKIGAPYSKELSSFISKLMTHNQKKRPEIKEVLCYPKMMDMKSNFEG
jgi:serine/threonine protein kinase